MGEESQETACDTGCRQQPANNWYQGSENSPRSSSQGVIPQPSSSLCCIAAAVGRAKEQREELVCIPGKIWLVWGFVWARDLSLGVVAACLLWCQFIGTAANAGDRRWKELDCVVFLHFDFSHFRVNLQLSCGRENFSSHSHTAQNKSACRWHFS